MRKAALTPKNLINRIAGCMSATPRSSSLRRRKASRGASPVAGQIDGLEERKLLTTILTDASGFKWDINDDGSIEGNRIDTGEDAYDGGHELSVLRSGGGSFVDFPDQTPVNEGGQELRFGPVNLASGVQVTRKVYVSFTESTVDDTRGFARFLDIVTNTSNVDATYTLQTDTNLGSDSNTRLFDSSDGDILVEGTDDWIETFDTSGNEDPNIGYVRFGSLSSERDASSFLSLTGDDVLGQNSFTIPAGETRILMQFAYQASDGTTRLGERLSRLDPALDALRGMSNEEVAQLVNFKIDDDLYDRISDPNDSIAQASPLPIRETVRLNNLTLNRENGTTDKDFFSYHAGDTGTAAVSLEFLHNRGDVNLRILQEDPFGSTVIASSLSGTDNEAVTFPVERGEVYIVEVDGAANPNYNLVATNFEVPVDGFDASGRNDTTETASLIANAPDGLHVGQTFHDNLSIDDQSPILAFGDDADFYRFTPAASGESTIDLVSHGMQSTFDLDFSVLDSAGNVVAQSDIFSFDKSVEFDAVGLEEYTIHVDGIIVQPRYSLQINTPEIQDDRFEANDRLFDATLLGPVAGTQLHRSLTLPEFDQDYFQFTATGSGDASVTVQHDTQQDVRVEIFEVRNGNPIRINSNGGTAFSATVGTTYIAEVIDFDQGIVADYSLNIQTPIPPAASGNVTATLRRSNLLINGDNGDNIFDVSQSGNTVTVTGLFGTTINGAGSAQFNVNLADINVRLPDGHNRVHIDGVTVSDDIIVKGGDGIDEVYIVDSNIADDINVNLGDQADVFRVANVDVDRIKAKTGNGRDSLGFNNNVNVATDFLVNTGKGLDTIVIEDVDVNDDVNIVTSDGPDRVFASSFDVADLLKVSLGKGNDTLWMRDSRGGKTTLNTGSDNDQIGLHNSTFASRVEKGVESTSFGLTAGQAELDALFSDLDDKISIFS